MIEDIKIPSIDVKKYGGKQLAIVDGKIVATGETSDEVVRKARKNYPDKLLSDIHILAVPKSIYVIYHA